MAFCVQGCVHIVKKTLLFIGNYYLIFQWNSHSDLIWSVVIALLFGILFSYYSNNDKVHKKLRGWGITRETSFPSEWFGAFLKNVTFIVLHLDGERRIYGWPIEWPSEAEKGHFVLVQASWLNVQESGEQTEIPLVGVDKIMIDVKEV